MNFKTKILSHVLQDIVPFGGHCPESTCALDSKDGNATLLRRISYHFLYCLVFPFFFPGMSLDFLVLFLNFLVFPGMGGRLGVARERLGRG